MKRILTAIVALPILLYTVWNDIPYFFVALTTVAVVLGLYEFYFLAARPASSRFSIAGYPASLLVLASFVVGDTSLIVAAVAILVMVLLGAFVFRPDDLSRALGSSSVTVFGVVYIALLAGFLIGVRMTPDTQTTAKLAAKLLTTFFAMVMMTDTGAYYTGRLLGRHKLAPRVSPGKTIEGSVGGFVAAVLAGLLCHLIFFPEFPKSHALVLGGTIGIVGQIGDLAESLLKRGAGVKDSGAIFPGHGGMLDRVDSILFCAPVLYYYSRIFYSAF